MKVDSPTLKAFLLSVKKVSDIYEKANEEQRGRLLVACQKLFDRGEELGLDRVWVETLVIGGKDFLVSLYGNGSQQASEEDARVIFG